MQFHGEVMQLGLGPGKSWEAMENKPNGCHISDPCTFSAFTYIIIAHCPTRFNLLFSIIMNCYIFSGIWKSGLFNIHSIKQSWKDLENVHKKVLESHGKPLSVSVRTL